jgi:hypothetical protein
MASPFLTSALAVGVLSASHRSSLTLMERAPSTHWKGDWVGPEPVWILWSRNISCPCHQGKSLLLY